MSQFICTALLFFNILPSTNPHISINCLSINPKSELSSEVKKLN